MSALRTTCPYCGVGCGIARVENTLKGDETHPANFGRLCSKGAALAETLDPADRLTAPAMFGRPASWDEALGHLAEQFLRIRDRHGPDSIAFYVSGQFLTEDYYVANKLMKGFIGSGNIDTNSRLCMASSVAGHIRAYGEDVAAGCYEDLEEADLIVLVGSNAPWCHPVLHQRMAAAREKRGSMIVAVDPRATAASTGADMHLAIAPGSDAMLFNGLLVHLARAGAFDDAWIAAHVDGCESALAAARASANSLSDIATATDLAIDDLRRFYDAFARTARVVTVYSQGVNQSVCGTDTVNAIINCHLATGRIARPGMGPFSLTGQPNAMGGREVGGLANQLAAHMSFIPQDIDRVRRFWRAPNIATSPGLKAVDMFEAVDDGRIKAIWIAATNPAASMPRADRVRAALAKCPLVVVSDAWATDTTSYAHVLLPAATWGEKDGCVTNSERRISRQRAFRAPPGLARVDWRMFAEVGRRMGWSRAFDYPNPAAIFREHAALSAYENGGARLFDLGALAELDDAAYDALEPIQWPVPKDSARERTSRVFANGVFSHSEGRARMIAIDIRPAGVETDWPLRLNTGRMRDQWHTMTRTGRAPRLMAHEPEPIVSVHPLDMRDYGLADNGLARLETADGLAIRRVVASDAMRRGDIFAAMHWTDQFASSGPIGKLTHALRDPISGQPDLKGARARIVPVVETWRGLLLRRNPAPLSTGAYYWAKAPVDAGWVYRLAGWAQLEELIDSEETLRELLAVAPAAELVRYSDPKRFVYRFAGVVGDRLESCVFFVGPESRTPNFETLADKLGRPIAPVDRLALVAGADLGQPAAPEKVVCSCFGVCESAIKQAIAREALASVADIGARLRAGTNCGSCIPELKIYLEGKASSLITAD